MFSASNIGKKPENREQPLKWDIVEILTVFALFVSNRRKFQSTSEYKCTFGAGQLPANLC